MKDLSRAYCNFFSGRTAYPVFHRRYGANDAFRYPQGFKIDETGKQIYLPGIGFVKYRRSRYIEGKAKNITVIRKADGWYVSIQTEYEKEVPVHQGDEVGMDMGVVWFCTLTDGTQISPCNALKKHLKKLVQLQRALSRKEKFSSNWRKAQREVAKLHQRIGNIRQDFINKVALDLSKKHAVIYREDLRIKNMTASAAGTVEEPGHNVAQKSGLNRAILDQAWGKFFQRLEWKCEQRGGQVIKVSPQYTSRICPICGYESKENRKSQASFECVACGYRGNADVVGARNIKVRGQRMSACGEFGEVGRAQVNRRMETVHGAGQQQE
ncbi:RNA-guided endonuclease InsQ/TnpB family protein, partial [Parasutterella secunda]|uniref:RNA-guided endonuclease InsQ/TnpB family protein n=1 Tax=Parasutterella secunda TaxID=626947 RepID=UPI0025A3F9CA